MTEGGSGNACVPKCKMPATALQSLVRGFGDDTGSTLAPTLAAGLWRRSQAVLGASQRGGSAYSPSELATAGYVTLPAMMFSPWAKPGSSASARSTPRAASAET